MSFYMIGKSVCPTARSISRRRLIKTASAAAGFAAGSGAVTGFPTIWAQNVKDVTLVHAGPPVAAIPQIGEQASKDLGFTIRMQATENVDLLNRFLSQSSAIDVGDVSIVFMKYVVGRNVLQAIPVSKYKYWDQTIPLFTKGVYPDGRKASTQGVAPYSVLYATGPDGQKFAKGPSDWLTGVPTITNADTLGIRPDLVGRPIDQLGRSDQPRIQRQGSTAGSADGRGHRCLDGGRSERPPAIREQGKHDPRRDRQDHRPDAGTSRNPANSAHSGRPSTSR